MARPKPKADDEKVDIHLYLPPDLAKIMREAAVKNFRAISSEIEFRLRRDMMQNP